MRLDAVVVDVLRLPDDAPRSLTLPATLRDRGNPPRIHPRRNVAEQIRLGHRYSVHLTPTLHLLNPPILPHRGHLRDIPPTVLKASKLTPLLHRTTRIKIPKPHPTAIWCDPLIPSRDRIIHQTLQHAPAAHIRTIFPAVINPLECPTPHHREHLTLRERIHLPNQ